MKQQIKITHFVGARQSIPVLRNPFRMESHFEWPYEVDLRCAPLGPRKKELISSGRLLWAPASSWISELRCAPLTQPSISNNQVKKSFRMALRRDLRRAPLGPRLENYFERKFVFW